MEVESGQEGADARAWGKDATHEATPHACPAAAERVQSISAAIGEQKMEDGTDFNMGAILDAMVEDFEERWGDGSNLLEFKYGQKGTGVGQPCGYTRE